MDESRLSREATAFAGDLTRVLNGTICDGIRIGCVTSMVRDTPTSRVYPIAFVGYGVTKSNLRALPFELQQGKNGRLNLVLSYRLTADDYGEHMMVASSVIALGVGDPSDERTLLHIDYEREKADGYPEAHLQVRAHSDDWDEATGGRRALEKLHLPAGGRRYRTTVEDVVEFLICEDLVVPRTHWQDVITQSREAFEERQLRAAVRRNPEVARDTLNDA